ncbi:hypothetical protein WJ972_16920 [Achromobacter insuavis]
MTKMVYSIGDLKELIGLSKWTVYDLIKKGNSPPRSTQHEPCRLARLRCA